MYKSKANVHEESINFPSLGVICGKGRERRKRKKISLKLSELSNFYHLQCTFLPPCSPLNVKWQGRARGLAAKVSEWQSGEAWSSLGRGGWDSPWQSLLGVQRGLWALRGWCSVPKPSVEATSATNHGFALGCLCFFVAQTSFIVF